MQKETYTHKWSRTLVGCSCLLIVSFSVNLSNPALLWHFWCRWGDESQKQKREGKIWYWAQHSFANNNSRIEFWIFDFSSLYLEEWGGKFILIFPIHDCVMYIFYYKDVYKCSIGEKCRVLTFDTFWTLYFVFASTSNVFFEWCNCFLLILWLESAKTWTLHIILFIL